MPLLQLLLRVRVATGLEIREAEVRVAERVLRCQRDELLELLLGFG